MAFGVVVVAVIGVRVVKTYFSLLRCFVEIQKLEVINVFNDFAND